MLEQAEGVFTEPPKRVIVCYNIFQDLFRRMGETVPNISFYQGLPDRATIEEWSAQTRGHLLLVFDDLYHELIQSKSVCDLTIMLSHHLNISCIMTSHNIFMCAKYSKTISTNLHYIGIFTLRDRRHLSILGSQFFAHKSKARNFVKVYDLVRSENSLGNPLIIDNSPRSTNRNYMLRSRVMPGQFPIIYEISWVGYTVEEFSLKLYGIPPWAVRDMDRVRRNNIFLQYLVSITSSGQRKSLLETASADQITALAEIAYNILSGVFELTNSELTSLQRYRSVLRKLASKHFRTDEKKTALLGQSIAVKICLLCFLVTIQL